MRGESTAMRQVRDVLRLTLTSISTGAFTEGRPNCAAAGPRPFPAIIGAGLVVVTGSSDSFTIDLASAAACCASSPGASARSSGSFAAYGAR